MLQRNHSPLRHIKHTESLLAVSKIAKTLVSCLQINDTDEPQGILIPEI